MGISINILKRATFKGSFFDNLIKIKLKFIQKKLKFIFFSLSLFFLHQLE